jgi:hypothetical protein
MLQHQFLGKPVNILISVATVYQHMQEDLGWFKLNGTVTSGAKPKRDSRYHLPSLELHDNPTVHLVHDNLCKGKLG